MNGTNVGIIALAVAIVVAALILALSQRYSMVGVGGANDDTVAYKIDTLSGKTRWIVRNWEWQVSPSK